MDVTSGDPGTGSLDQLQVGTSYELVRGADTQRPTSCYANTRNIKASSGRLDQSATWLGADSEPEDTATMSGLTDSQGQIVTSDGGAQQSNDASLGNNGVLKKAAVKATGGNATGQTDLNRIR